MRLYICTDGSYAGTQADAGKGWTQVEVPTDKPGLLGYLNGLGASKSTPEPVEAPVARDTAFRGTHAPATTPRGLQALSEGRELDQVEAWIDRAHGWQLVRLVGMVTHRLSELARGL